jgi:hypothetical protein
MHRLVTVTDHGLAQTCATRAHCGGAQRRDAGGPARATGRGEARLGGAAAAGRIGESLVSSLAPPAAAPHFGLDPLAGSPPSPDGRAQGPASRTVTVPALPSESSPGFKFLSRTQAPGRTSPPRQY